MIRALTSAITAFEEVRQRWKERIISQTLQPCHFKLTEYSSFIPLPWWPVAGDSSITIWINIIFHSNPVLFNMLDGTNIVKKKNLLNSLSRYLCFIVMSKVLQIFKWRTSCFISSRIVLIANDIERKDMSGCWNPFDGVTDSHFCIVS